MAKAQAGSVVKYIKDGSRRDMTVGKLYVATSVEGSSIWVIDDALESHALTQDETVVVGNLNNTQLIPPAALTDTMGKIVAEGDYIAYACSDHALRTYKVLEIKGTTAEVRHIDSGNKYRIGDLENRAMKLDDYSED